MKVSSLFIFEDQGYRGFGPLTLLRPVWELRCGGFTIADRIRIVSGSSLVSFIMRKHLLPVFNQSNKPEKPLDASDYQLYINGRLLLERDLFNRLASSDEDTAWYIGNQLAAVRVSDPAMVKVTYDADGIPIIEPLAGVTKVGVKATLAAYTWQLINNLPEQISADMNLYLENHTVHLQELPGSIMGRDDAGIHTSGEVEFSPGVVMDALHNKVLLGNGAKIRAGAILDATHGPIWIDDGAEVQTGAIIMGPAYIGTDSIVRPGARISSAVSLGPQCRVGGEVSSTIMQGFSNKQHSGFLGNSFVGEWVNLGAATDNSDLKNNYRPVEVLMSGKPIQTGELHVGAIIGDFSRTAIHTRLNTGTVIGTCCNILTPDFPSRDIPPFTWVGSEGNIEYRFDKAVETIRAVMPRRGRVLTPELEELLHRVFLESRKQA